MCFKSDETREIFISKSVIWTRINIKLIHVFHRNYEERKSELRKSNLNVIDISVYYYQEMWVQILRPLFSHQRVNSLGGEIHLVVLQSVLGCLLLYFK